MSTNQIKVEIFPPFMYSKISEDEDEEPNTHCLTSKIWLMHRKVYHSVHAVFNQTVKIS